MSWENIIRKGKDSHRSIGSQESTGPYKGSKGRQEEGWDAKLNTLEDTNIFLNVLVDIYGWNKKEIFYFLERPYKWQDEYEVFKRTLDLRHYSNDNIDDDLDSDTFADWFAEEYPELNWDALGKDLNELERVREK